MMTEGSKLTLNHVADALFGVSLSPEWRDRIISDTVIDSRAATAGSLFVALRGEKTDGHLFVNAAFEGGATAAIAQDRALEACDRAAFVMPDGAVQVRGPATETQRAREHLPVVFVVPDSLAALQQLATWWRSRLPVVTIGVTGSVGKTTTKETIANVRGALHDGAQRRQPEQRDRPAAHAAAPRSRNGARRAGDGHVHARRDRAVVRDGQASHRRRDERRTGAP